MYTAAWTAARPQTGSAWKKAAFENQATPWIKYVPVGYSDTHSKVVGYLLWLIGFTGAHRFYYGRPVTGVIWFLTFGLLGIGWIVDFFLIPAMDRDADHRFQPGRFDYSLTWMLLVFTGFLGLHRFYQEKWVSGLIYLLTFGVFGIGIVYDVLTLNHQLDERHRRGIA
jgi:TM2 domain-containing membrane protein YozV